MALVEHILESNQKTYPFGKSGLPTGTDAQIAATNAEVQRLLDTHDAVADLGLAEGIHQVVQGNFDRAAATLEAFSSGKLPPPVYRLERIAHVQSELAAPLNDLRLLQTELTSLLDDLAAHQDDLVDNVDGRLHRFVTALAALGRYGLPETGFGVALAWKRNRYQALLQKVQELVDRWQGNLDRFDTLMAAYNALPASTPDDERFAALQEIEAQVAIVLTNPLPATPAAYQTVALGRRADFVTKRNAFNNILAATGNDLAALLHLIAASSRGGRAGNGRLPAL